MLEQRRQKGRRWYAKHKDLAKARLRAHKQARRDYVASLKDSPCTDCGVKYPPYVMQFDHVHGQKRRNVSEMLTSSLESILEEISKCELVCANCHAARTHKRRVAGVVELEDTLALEASG